ncbi:MAG: nuclear transport factor 2 family protein [Archangium sp.]
MKIQGSRPVATTPQAAGASAPVESKPVAATQAAGWAAKTGAAAPTTAAVEAKTRAAAEGFFKAFGSHDLKTLDASYAPNAKFHDDMFTLTKKDSVMKMWTSAPPFKKFDAEIIDVKGNEVHARWTCDYEMFGNKVHNVIDSKLTFDDQGRITSQQEHWDTQKWMSQALPIVPRFLQGAAYFVMRPLLSWQMGG